MADYGGFRRWLLTAAASIQQYLIPEGVRVDGVDHIGPGSGVGTIFLFSR